MIVARFNCGECGYGPFEVEDNRDAPIPLHAVPMSIHHDDAEGRPLSSCTRCDAPLPEFLRERHVACTCRRHEGEGHMAWCPRSPLDQRPHARAT